MMAYTLPIGKKLSDRGWRVKISDKERCETPHVTIIRGKHRWRYSLRGGGFLDNKPPPREVADEVTEVVDANMDLLRREWNRMYGRINLV
jgi:hypothetical protein